MKNGNVERAMISQKKLQKEGLLKELKQKQFFEKPSAKKKKKSRGYQKISKKSQEKMERLGY